jgi:ATP-dependent DNA ligase
MGADAGRNETLRMGETGLVAQIEFAEWTPDGHLRQAKFVGVREDKEAQKVVREIRS